MSDIIIGRVFKTANNRYRQYNIYSAKGYGVTCPGLFTTNGSAPFLADCLIGMINDAPFVVRDIPDYTVQVYLDNVRYTDKQLLLNALLANHAELWGKF